MTPAVPPTGPSGRALFGLAFRPFFFGAAVFAVLAVALWARIMNFGSGIVVSVANLLTSSMNSLFSLSSETDGMSTSSTGIPCRSLFLAQSRHA